MAIHYHTSGKTSSYGNPPRENIIDNPFGRGLPDPTVFHKKQNEDHKKDLSSEQIEDKKFIGQFKEKYANRVFWLVGACCLFVVALVVLQDIETPFGSIRTDNLFLTSLVGFITYRAFSLLSVVMKSIFK